MHDVGDEWIPMRRVGGGGTKPGTVGMCVARDRPRRGALLSILSLSPPPLSLSTLHSTPRQDCFTIVQV